MLLAGEPVATQRQVLLQLTHLSASTAQQQWALGLRELGRANIRAPSAPAPLSVVTGGGEDLAKSPKERKGNHTLGQNFVRSLNSCPQSLQQGAAGHCEQQPSGVTEEIARTSTSGGSLQQFILSVPGSRMLCPYRTAW